MLAGFDGFQVRLDGLWVLVYRNSGISHNGPPWELTSLPLVLTNAKALVPQEDRSSRPWR